MQLMLRLRSCSGMRDTFNGLVQVKFLITSFMFAWHFLQNISNALKKSEHRLGYISESN